MTVYKAKIGVWGTSLALRIPKALVDKYKLKRGKVVELISEKNAIKIIV